MNWNEMLQDEMNKEYYQNEVKPFLQEEYSNHECYPPKNDVFNAFYAIPSPEDVKVVIIGQDPYHGPGQANGLSFSVHRDCTNPPSLVNIINEVYSEYPEEKENIPKDIDYGDLTFWANQGVLMLNATLTVRKGEANSHAECGWQTFTDNMIKRICELSRPIVFMLWGKFAKKKENLIMNTSNNNILVLKASHPSPFSATRGFLGCGHFRKCNKFLKEHGLQEIDWVNAVEKTEYVQADIITKQPIVEETAQEHYQNCESFLSFEDYNEWYDEQPPCVISQYQGYVVSNNDNY
jgi:uracil-DNA glycosylase